MSNKAPANPLHEQAKSPKTDMGELIMLRNKIMIDGVADLDRTAEVHSPATWHYRAEDQANLEGQVMHQPPADNAPTPVLPAQTPAPLRELASRALHIVPTPAAADAPVEAVLTATSEYPTAGIYPEPTNLTAIRQNVADSATSYTDASPVPDTMDVKREEFFRDTYVDQRQQHDPFEARHAA